MVRDIIRIEAPGSVGKVEGNATGIVNYHSSADLETTFRTIAIQSSLLRPSLSAQDAKVLDEAVVVLEDRDNRDRGEVAQRLLVLLGVAAAAGEAGQSLLSLIEQARHLAG
jgi:hypothetical protein